MPRANHDIEPDSPNGWEDGQDSPGRGRRFFFAGEDPLALAFPLMRAGRVRLRVHWVVPLFVVCELVAALPPARRAFGVAASLVGSLLVLVVIRELGRGIWARRFGPSADCVTLWPLGGLNTVAGPESTRPVLAEAGGLLVNACLVPVLALCALLAGSGAGDLLLINPLTPGAFLNNTVPPWPVERMIAWSAYYANAALLVVNLALPMLPLDAGRMAAAWMRRHGDSFAAAERAVKIGLYVAVAMFIVSAMTGQTRLMILATCGFLATLVESRRAQLLRAEQPYEPAWSTGPGDEEDPQPRKKPRDARSEPTVLRTTSADLDRVLAKITREGLSSLTTSERELLAKETKRRRGG
jgi:Zn-dependent protease